MRWMFFLLIFTQNSCQPNRQPKTAPITAVSIPTECELYYKFVQENFRPDTTGSFREKDLFPYNNSESRIRTQRRIINQCIIGMKKDVVIAIFGTPSYASKERFDYFFNENCAKGSVNPRTVSIKNCARLKIYFDENDLVRMIPAMGYESGLSY